MPLKAPEASSSLTRSSCRPQVSRGVAAAAPAVIVLVQKTSPARKVGPRLPQLQPTATAFSLALAATGLSATALAFAPS